TGIHIHLNTHEPTHTHQAYHMLVIHATGNSRPDERKRAILLHALGTEELFYALHDTVNVVAERHKFCKRAQRLNETINQFLASLHELAAEQMLHDKLIECVANTRIQDRLLLQPDLTLAKATTLALQIETGLRNADVLPDTTAAAPVRAIHTHFKLNRHGLICF
uniref:Uncharacterized protein n=1 Tax=Amphiprion ocellaris TaxID=80972 RepID=A0AAQ5XJR9_AMPOC